MEVLPCARPSSRDIALVTETQSGSDKSWEIHTVKKSTRSSIEDMPAHDECLGKLGQMGWGEHGVVSDGRRDRSSMHNDQGVLASESWADIPLETCRIGGARTQVSAEIGLQGQGRQVPMLCKGVLQLLAQARCSGGPCSLSLALHPTGPHLGVILLKTRLLRERRGEWGHSFPPSLTTESQG